MFKGYNKQKKPNRRYKKRTYERIDKVNDENISKVYAEYKQCELNEKD